MTLRRFKQIDVFTQEALLGNPVAVVLDGEGLSDAVMQSFAKWTQLSETTFLLPPTAAGKAAGADYRLRIFTPGGELPFAGHPTLGSARAWLAGGGQPAQKNVLLQECGVGLVRLEAQEGRWAFAAPPSKKQAVPQDKLQALLTALGVQAHQVIDSQILNNGPEWWSFLLDSPDTVLALSPNHLALKQLGAKVGVAAIYQNASRADLSEASSNEDGHSLLISRSNREARAFKTQRHSKNAPENTGPHLEVRAFAAAIGILEDPVTGSLNASLAQWLIANGKMPPQYTAAQGTTLGRQGRVFIHQDAQGQVWVGGDTVVCIEGHVALD